MRILKDFKSFRFVSADSKRVTGAFCGSADSKGVKPVFARDWHRNDIMIAHTALFAPPPPGGSLYEVEKKGVAEKGVWKLLKIKDDFAQKEWGAQQGCVRRDWIR